VDTAPRTAATATAANSFIRTLPYELGAWRWGTCHRKLDAPSHSEGRAKSRAERFLRDCWRFLPHSLWVGIDEVVLADPKVTDFED
jgi:hypothetical protein